MLKLTRRPFPDEEIYIYGKDGKPVVKLSVVSIRGNQVSLGFTAPKDIVIKRGEIMTEDDRLQADDYLSVQLTP